MAIRCRSTRDDRPLCLERNKPMLSHDFVVAAITGGGLVRICILWLWSLNFSPDEHGRLVDGDGALVLRTHRR